MNTDPQVSRTVNISIAKTWSEISEHKPFWSNTNHLPSADFDFYKLILECRKGNSAPRVFIASVNKSPVALLIARQEKTHTPITFGYSTLARISSNKLVIIEGGYIGIQSNTILHAFFSSIKSYAQENKIDLISIENERIDSDVYTFATKIQTDFLKGQSRPPSIHWQMSGWESWEHFLSKLSKKRRYWLNRLPRILNKDFANNWNIKRYNTQREADAFLETAEKVACKTYHRGLKTGFINNNETKERAFAEAKAKQLDSYILFINNNPAAFWFNFKRDTILYLASTGYDPKFKKYELGTVLLSKIIENTFSEQNHIQTIDFGLGDAEYKRRFANVSYHESTILLFPLTLKGITLFSIIRTTSSFNSMAKKTLGKIGVARIVKTRWRRLKSDSNQQNNN